VSEIHAIASDGARQTSYENWSDEVKRERGITEAGIKTVREYP
jgi:hypothetical protein